MRFSVRLSALSFLAALSSLVLAGPAGAQALKVDDIKVQLFYELSGTLSDDLTKQKKLSLWNTLIGEGDAKVMQRQFSGIAFNRTGRVVKALFVENRTCASIEITARSGDSVRTEALRGMIGTAKTRR
jgi:hypothetical protein